MKDKLDRANREEIRKEVSNRMRLLKLDDRILSHFKNGDLFYSHINDLLPFTDEMVKAVYTFSKDSYIPYHAIYNESSLSGRLLYVLGVSVDKADWKQERSGLGKSLEVPCDIIFLDKNAHEKGSVLLTSIAEDAFQPSERRPIVAESSSDFDFFPDPRNAWLAVKSFFEDRCL